MLNQIIALSVTIIMFRVRRPLPVLLQIHRTMATQGFGCMGFSAFYSSANKTTPEKAKAVVELAVSKGYTTVLYCSGA